MRGGFIHLRTGERPTAERHAESPALRGRWESAVTARTFQFPQYAAERSAQLTSAPGTYPPSGRRAGGRPWGWLFLLSVVGGIWCVVSGYVYWSAPLGRDSGSWLTLGGMGLLAFSAVCFCLWVWRFVHGNPPWGRLMLLGLLLDYLVGRPLV